MKKWLIFVSIILLITIIGGIYFYITNSTITESDARRAISNYLYEEKLGQCNSDSLDKRIWGNDCENYYRCYSDEYSLSLEVNQVNEIKNHLTNKRSKLSYEQVKIIPEIENHDQFSSYDINNKCFIKIYENKGLVSANDAKNYFETISKQIFKTGSMQSNSFCNNVYKVTDEQSCQKIIICLINAIKSDLSSSEATAIANFIKSDESKYEGAGFEMFRSIKVVQDNRLKDFTDQCGKV